MNTVLSTEMNTLLDNNKADYLFVGGKSEIRQRMTKDFNDGLSYKVGKKYIKVMTDRAVWGFVVNVDDDVKFKKGDILMAAGYSTPARNKPRGNIVDGGYTVQWTGPRYL